METFSTKQKSLFCLVMTMSIPSVLSMLINSLYNIVDSFFVAQISENAMTALSLVFPVQNLVIAISVGFGVGINALIALRLGAKDQRSANISASLGLLLSAIHGVLLMFFCIGGIPWFLKLFTQDPDVLSLGITYSTIAFSFTFSVNVGIALEKIFQSVGRMKTSMFVMFAGCLTNIILDPLMIFGIGPFPKLGIAGAALATGIGQTIQLLLYIIIAVSKPLPVSMNLKSAKPEKEITKHLYYIGIPAALNLALPSLLISILNSILSGFSQIYVVILGIYYKLQTFVYLPANGILQGVRPLIGYNYGAGEYKNVKKIYKITLFLSLFLMLIGTGLCMLLPEQLISMFASNKETIEAGAQALRIISIGFLISAVSITTSGALEGLGKGFPSLMISLLRYVLFMIPAALLLSRLLGASGIWHAFWVTEISAGLLSYFLLYRKYFSRLLISKSEN